MSIWEGKDHTIICFIDRQGKPMAYLCLWWCLWRPWERRWWSRWCLWCLWRWLWLWPLALLLFGRSEPSSGNSNFSWSPWLPLLWRLLTLPIFSYLESSDLIFIMLSSLSFLSAFSSSDFCWVEGRLFLASSSRILALARTRLYANVHSQHNNFPSTWKKLDCHVKKKEKRVIIIHSSL